MLCLVGAVPNLLLLRVVEAMHGMTPSFAKDSMGMFAIYYSSTLQVKFDPKTNRPEAFTWDVFESKLYGFVLGFVQTSLLFSILLPLDYNIAPQRPIQSLWDLYYWGNIVNAFAMASLISLVLDGGSAGLGLLTSICTGLTMEEFSYSPLTQSTSPSDFWGNRWDRPVTAALRRGAFKPLRKAGCSRHVAAVLTFLISGVIHEYILWIMVQRQGIPNNPSGKAYQPSIGNHFVFFVWNAIVLSLERLLEGHPIIVWMQSNLPKPIRTALVLLTVLPIGHLFTDEYVESCFFSDQTFAFPKVTIFLEPIST